MAEVTAIGGLWCRHHLFGCEQLCSITVAARGFPPADFAGATAFAAAQLLLRHSADSKFVAHSLLSPYDEQRIDF